MPSAPPNTSWFIVGRWQQYEGEARANLLRIIAIGVFYLIELYNFYGPRWGWTAVGEGVDVQFHRQVTALAVGWVLVALGTLVALERQFFPPALPYATTALDLLLLTALLMVADGPRSPLLVAYFLVIAASALRFQLGLVRLATLGALVGYAVLLGYAKWFAAARGLTVPRYQQLMMLAALALAGIITGQVIRRARRLAEHYARQLAAPGGPAP